jgi:hypothetical protein
MNEFPQSITTLVDELATMRGAVAVVLGGSRAFGADVASSDWDIGLYALDGCGRKRLARWGSGTSVAQHERERGPTSGCTGRGAIDVARFIGGRCAAPVNLALASLAPRDEVRRRDEMVFKC